MIKISEDIIVCCCGSVASQLPEQSFSAAAKQAVNIGNIGGTFAHLHLKLNSPLVYLFLAFPLIELQVKNLQSKDPIQ